MSTGSTYIAPSTTDVVLDRLGEGSTPSNRSDDHRVALVVEGGGMRGVISGGMLLALEQLGMRDCFDFVVGTSAGAICAAFFTTGRATEGSVIYYTALNNAPFLNRRRMFKLQPAMDLDYLIDEACTERGLVLSEVAESDLPVYATVTPATAWSLPDDTDLSETPTDAEHDPAEDDATADTRPTLMRLDGDDDQVAAILKATATLPVLGGPSRTVDDALYVDGGLTEQLPWRSAASLGATHILAIPSRPVFGADERSAMNFVERLTVGNVVKALHGDHVAHLIQTMPERVNAEIASLRSIANGTGSALTWDIKGWHGEVEIVDVPADTPIPDRMETERPVLVDAMSAGADAILDHFGFDEISVEHRITLNHPRAKVARFRSEALADIVTETTAST